MKEEGKEHLRTLELSDRLGRMIDEVSTMARTIESGVYAVKITSQPNPQTSNKPKPKPKPSPKTRAQQATGFGGLASMDISMEMRMEMKMNEDEDENGDNGCLARTMRTEGDGIWEAGEWLRISAY